MNKSLLPRQDRSDAIRALALLCGNNPPLDRRRPVQMLELSRESVSWVPMAFMFAAGMVAMFLVMA